MIESFEARDPTQLLLEQLLQPALIILIALLIGIFFERVILAWLKNLASRTPMGLDDLLLNIFSGGVSILWATLLGMYYATQQLELSSVYAQYVSIILLVIFIISVTIAIPRLIVNIIVLNSDIGEISYLSIFNNVIRIAVYTIGFVLILTLFQIPITPILAAIGVGGLGVSFALQTTFENLFSGIQLTITRRLHPGDYIQLSSGEEGYVTDINWSNTLIKQWDNNMVIVPNAALTTALITNYHDQEKQMLVWVNMHISYTSDLERVERITIEETKRVIKKFRKGPISEILAQAVVYELTHGTITDKLSKVLVRKLNEAAAFTDMASEIMQELDMAIIAEVINTLKESTVQEELVKEVIIELLKQSSLSQKAIREIHTLFEVGGLTAAHQEQATPNRVKQREAVAGIERAVVRKIRQTVEFHNSAHAIMEELSAQTIKGLYRQLRKPRSYTETMETLTQLLQESETFNDTTTELNRTIREGAFFEGMAKGLIQAIDQNAIMDDVNASVRTSIENGTFDLYEPFIRYSAFSDYSVTFGAYFYIEEFMAQYKLKHEIYKHIHTRYQREGIQIPLQTHYIHMNPAPDPTTAMPGPDQPARPGEGKE